MKVDLVQHLSAIGLSHREAIIYEALLASGPTTVVLIAKSSEMKRPTVYNIVDSLVAKGLVYYEVQGKKKLIVAENPDRIGGLLAKQKQIFDAILPRLQTLHLSSCPSESLLTEFQGIQSVQSAYTSLLKGLNEGDEYLVISNQDKWLNLATDFFEKFIEERAQITQKTRLLLQDTPHAREFQKKQLQYHEEIKFLPAHIDININMVITPLKTLITQLTPPIFSLVIKNKNLVDMNHVLFNLLWDIC